MTTIGQLEQRVYRDYLHAPDEQPTMLLLDGAHTDATTTLAYLDDTIAPDEASLIGPGTVLEIDREQVLVTAGFDTPLTVRRGYNGTVAAAHTAGTPVLVRPKWPRATVFDALADQIVGLWPQLWRNTSATVTSGSGLLEVPAEVVTITDAFRMDATNTPRVYNAELHTGLPVAVSSTGKAVQVSGGPAGETVHLTYRARFARPTDPSDTLDSLGVDESWAPIVIVGAVAQVIAGRDVDGLTAEFITAQLEQDKVPVGTGTTLRDALLRYREYLLGIARRELMSDRPTPVKYLPTFR